MRDPHIHAEKTIVPGFGNAEMRELILKGTGLACDMPKMVGTGCGRRRPFAMTSKQPGKITCLACREWAAKQHAEAARLGRDLIEWMEKDPAGFANSNVTAEQLAEEAAKNEEIAAQYQ